MGPQEDYIETVVTCEGDFYDPEFHSHLQDFSKRLQDLIITGQRELIVKKVEPWNSVRVTFNIPKEAAVRLKQLAEMGDRTLRDLGVLAVQVDGDRLISLTIAGRNNERTELVLQTTESPRAATNAAASASFNKPTVQVNQDMPGPSSMEAARKNIAQFIQDGQQTLKNLFGSGDLLDNFKPPESIAGGMPDPQQALFGKALAGMAGPGHLLPPGLEHFPFLPGVLPGGFPTSSVGRSQTFTSPPSNHSPLSPNYPTPPPSVSNPSSPGVRAATAAAAASFPLSVAGTNSALLNNLPRLLGSRDITSSSPLLVNLLQNDVGGLGHLNNLMSHKLSGMPFPPVDLNPPPPRKKRKPRKPKEGKMKVPAGQDATVMGGVASTSQDLHAMGLQGTMPPGEIPLGFAEPMDTSGQSTSQEPVTSSTSQRNSITGVLSSSSSLIATEPSAMPPGPLMSPVRLQSPLKTCHSPGRANSPRAISPGRSHSPARALSPGRSMSPVRSKSPGSLSPFMMRGPTPQHILNPVTGQLELASSPDLRARAALKEDISDIAHTQLKPPPNPLVMLKKNIASSPNTLAVSTVVASTARQSSPLMGGTGMDNTNPLSAMESCARSTRSELVSSSVFSSTACVLSRNTITSQELVHSSQVLPFTCKSTTISDVNNSHTTVSRQLTLPSTSVVPSVMYSGASSNSPFHMTHMASVPNSLVATHPVSRVAPMSPHGTNLVASSNSQTLPPPVSVLHSTATTTSTVMAKNSAPTSEYTPTSTVALSIASHASMNSNFGQVQLSSASATPSSASANLICHGSLMPSLATPNGQGALATSTTLATGGAAVAISAPSSTDYTTPNTSTASTASSKELTDNITSSKTSVEEPLKEKVATSVAMSDKAMLKPLTAVNNVDHVAAPSQEQSSSPSPVKVQIESSQSDTNSKPMVQDMPEDTISNIKLSPLENVCIESRTSALLPGGLLPTQETNCTHNASTSPSPDHEPCPTDGSDTSSLVAHSQGKDSGIADIGHKLSFMDKEGHSDTMDVGRSNGASTSEATASPLSETDTVSSNHVSPSIRSISVGLTNHDSELSNHSFEEHPPSNCVVPNAQGTLRMQAVPRISNANGPLKEAMGEHPPVSTSDSSTVITVGYATQEQPTLNLSPSGLSDKSLPFLTKPSSPYHKDSNDKGFVLSDHFPSKELLDERSKEATAEPHSTLNNGDLDSSSKDYLNWSKTLNLPPKLLGKSDLNPGGVCLTVGDGETAGMVVAGPERNGDDPKAHLFVSQAAAFFSKHSTMEYTCSGAKQSNHAHGVLSSGISGPVRAFSGVSYSGTNSVQVQINSGLETAFKCDNHLDMLKDKIRHETKTSEVSVSRMVAASEAMASSPCGTATTDSVQTKEATSTLASHAAPAACPKITEAASVPVRQSASNSSSVPVVITTGTDTLSPTLTNTFGASMVTAVLTTTVSMGGSVTVTSFSHPVANTVVTTMTGPSTKCTTAVSAVPVVSSVSVDTENLAVSCASAPTTQHLPTVSDEPSKAKSPVSQSTSAAISNATSVIGTAPAMISSTMSSVPHVLATSSMMSVQSLPEDNTKVSQPTSPVGVEKPVASTSPGCTGHVPQTVAPSSAVNSTPLANACTTAVTTSPLASRSMVCSSAVLTPASLATEVEAISAVGTAPVHPTSPTAGTCKSTEQQAVPSVPIGSSNTPNCQPEPAVPTAGVKEERPDAKTSSRGISIMKPLYDRDLDLEEELQTQTQDHPKPHLDNIAVPAASLPKCKSPYTVAHLLEAADKQRRSQGQLKQHALFMNKLDTIRPPEVSVVNDTEVGVLQIRGTKNAITPVKAPAVGGHHANFVQKSLQTPSLYNTPHPITSPGFPLNLTESVQKVMNAIPLADTTPPPSPKCNKAGLSPGRQRPKSVSPVQESRVMNTEGKLETAVHQKHGPKQDSSYSGNNDTSYKGNTNTGGVQDMSTSSEQAHTASSSDILQHNQVEHLISSPQKSEMQNVESQPQQTSPKPSLVPLALTKSPETVLETSKVDKPENVDKQSPEPAVLGTESAKNPDKRKEDHGATLIVSPIKETVQPNIEPEDAKTPLKSTIPADESSLLEDEPSLSSEHSYSAPPPGACESPSKQITPTKAEEIIAGPVLSSTPTKDVKIPLTIDTTPSKAEEEMLAKEVGTVMSNPESKVNPTGVISAPVHMSSSPKEESDGPRTLVIKIIGAHSTKESTVKTLVRQERISSPINRSDRISPPIVSNLLKESTSSVIDLPSLGKFQQVSVPPHPEQSTSKSRGAAQQKVSTSPVNVKSEEVTPTEMPEVNTRPSTPDILPAEVKRRSPSLDAMSETSSVDVPIGRTRLGSSTDRGDSPAPSRPVRMSTRNNGRRRNSPSDSSTEDAIRPTVRGTKRTRAAVVEDESSNDAVDKKVKLEENSEDPGAETAEALSATTFYNKKVGRKPANARGPSPPLGTAGTKAETTDNSGTGSGKRSKAKTNSFPTTEEVEQDDVLSKTEKEDAGPDAKGKRTTRSSKNKEHCELPNAAQAKRRRTSREHR